MDGQVNVQNEPMEGSQAIMSDYVDGSLTHDISLFQLNKLNQDSHSNRGPDDNDVQIDPNIEKLSSREEPIVASSVSDNFNDKQSSEGHLPHAVQPSLQCQQCDSSESSSSYQGSSSGFSEVILKMLKLKRHRHLVETSSGNKVISWSELRQTTMDLCK